MPDNPSPTRNCANAGVTVQISPMAEPRHLRDMAAWLQGEAARIEGRA